MEKWRRIQHWCFFHIPAQSSIEKYTDFQIADTALSVKLLLYGSDEKFLFRRYQMLQFVDFIVI